MEILSTWNFRKKTILKHILSTALQFFPNFDLPLINYNALVCEILDWVVNFNLGQKITSSDGPSTPHPLNTCGADLRSKFIFLVIFLNLENEAFSNLLLCKKKRPSIKWIRCETLSTSTSDRSRCCCFSNVFTAIWEHPLNKAYHCLLTLQKIQHAPEH